MNKLGFGLMRLPLKKDNCINQEEFNKMVDILMENGVNYFDTAYPYHGGNSEKSFKKAVVDRYPRDSFILADKMPLFALHEESQMEEIFNEQIERCGVEYFDNYLLHNVSNWTKEGFMDIDSFSFVKEKKKEGFIKHIGISLHDDSEFLKNILDQHPEIEFVQLQINYADWESKGVEARKCYEICKEYNKPVIVMEPVRGGSLAEVPLEAEKIMKEYNSEFSVASWAIRFAASLSNVQIVLSGMSNLEQALDNISYMKDFKKLNKKEYDILREVNKIIRSQKTINCTSCGYCLEYCPKNIYIPKCFELYNDEKQITNAGGASTPTVYYNTLIEGGYSKASECIECNTCVKYCPQHLEIPKHLKEVANLLEPQVDAVNKLLR